MLQRLAQLLSEPVMGFLALAALVFGVTPELFDVDPQISDALTVAEWIVVGLFALEYTVNLQLAGNKRAYVLDPWRVLDLVIIVAPLVSLIPGTPEAARSSPVLRVLRLVRAILAGTRASARLRRQDLAVQRRLPSGPPLVTRLDPDAGSPTGLDWDGLMAWLAHPAPAWLHASQLATGRIDDLAQATGLPRALFDSALGEAAFPRLESGARWAALSVSLPREDGRREPILLLVADDAVLSLSLYASELLGTATPLPGTAQRWPMRVVLGILRLVLQRHEAITGAIEREVRALEDLPADESPAEFFEGTFQMRKRITMSKADLWRLRAVLAAVAEGRRTLPGLEADARGEFEHVAAEAAALHDTADGVREALLSLLELHLNVSGYGMNRFMRLLAIVSALALIPTIVGGLLGMNLVTNPWPATLAQVAFGTLVLMLCMLYTFLAKGWLK